jgi:hypothetical protein
MGENYWIQIYFGRNYANVITVVILIGGNSFATVALKGHNNSQKT